MSIACLIFDPDVEPMPAGILDELCRSRGWSLDVLGAEKACEVKGITNEPESRAAVRDALGHERFDFAFLPEGPRRKRALLADMDSTVITVECIDELADMAGLRARIAAVTERAMNGEVDFFEALRERVALLEGLDAGVIARVLEERVRLTPGARTMVATMRAGGATAVLVSGGFTAFTGVVAERAGFTAHHGNQLEVGEDGRLTGGLIPLLLGADFKCQTLLEVAKRGGFSPAEVVAVGDGANDRAMVEAAGLGVGYRPHAALAEAADVVIRHGDLTSVLYLQGYKEEEFVTG